MAAKLTDEIKSVIKNIENCTFAYPGPWDPGYYPGWSHIPTFYVSPTGLDYSFYKTNKHDILEVKVPGYVKEDLEVSIKNKHIHIKILKDRRVEKAYRVGNSNTSKELCLPLVDSQLISEPTVTLDKGILSITWELKPQFNLENKKLTIK